MRKKTRPVATYRMPSRLWSTVTTHSWRRSRTPLRAAVSSGLAMLGDSTLTVASPGGLVEGRQIRGDRVQLIARELHRRHAGAHLDGLRIVHPRAQVLWRVRRGAGG